MPVAIHAHVTQPNIGWAVPVGVCVQPVCKSAVRVKTLS